MAMEILKKHFTYFEELSDSLFIVDLNGKILDFNKQAYESLGYTKNELKKLKISDIDIHETDCSVDEKISMFKKNVFIKFQTKHVRKDGSLIDVLVKIKPISVEEKSYFLCIIQDISEIIAKTERLEILVEKLEKTQTELIEKCSFTESLINTAQTIILVLDCNGKIVRFNPYMEKISGYKLAEVNGKDWFATFLPGKDRARIRENFKSIIAGTSIVNNINPILTKERQIRNIIWNSKALINSENNIIGTLSIGIDFTERSKLEEELQYFKKAVENSTDGIAMATPEGKHFYQNNAFGRLFGKSVEEIEGKSGPPGTVYVDESIGREVFKTTMLGNSWIGDVEMFDKNKNVLNIFLRGYSIKDTNNKVIGIVGVHTDVTAYKKYEEQLKTTNIKLEKSNNIKSKFLSHMNHEIRTPLNGILGIVDILQDTKLSDEQRELLDVVKESSNNLLNIAVQTLDYSRLESGSIQLNNELFDINSLLDEINFLFKVEADNKSLEFYLLRKQFFPYILIGDVLKLKQIIINLCNNAIKFTHKGKITLAVSVVEETTSDVNIKFSVTDTGIGILEENKEKLFKKFSQINPSSRKYAGVGLGLSISKELVELMEGIIGVDSTTSNGSEFWFTIPFKKDKDISSNNQQLQIKKDTKILIAEDNIINTLIEEKLLKNLGFKNIDTVVNGKEAVKVYKKNDYDIILMDCLMPEMTGIKAAKKIRKIEKNKSHIPIIAVTANGKEWDKDKCIKAGMDDYIEKPISKELLVKILSKYLV